MLDFQSIENCPDVNAFCSCSYNLPSRSKAIMLEEDAPILVDTQTGNVYAIVEYTEKCVLVEGSVDLIGIEGTWQIGHFNTLGKVPMLVEIGERFNVVGAMQAFSFQEEVESRLNSFTF